MKSSSRLEAAPPPPANYRYRLKSPYADVRSAHSQFSALVCVFGISKDIPLNILDSYFAPTDCMSKHA